MTPCNYCGAVIAHAARCPYTVGALSAIRGMLAGAALLASACGQGQAPVMAVGEACTRGDLTVQLEADYRSVANCGDLAAILAEYEDSYDARFGHQGPITVRLRSASDLRETGDASEDYLVSGHTFAGGVIDLARSALESLPHELNHVRKGGGHGGWCSDYEPWSEEVLGWNQRAYLGCD